MGEKANGRESMDKFRGRLERQEQAERQQAQREGKERPRRDPNDLDRIARETARRHDRRTG